GSDVAPRGRGPERNPARVVGEARPPEPLPAGVVIVLAVEGMEEKRIAELLAGGEDRKVAGLEDIVMSLDGVGHVDRAYARFARHAVELLHRRDRIAHRHRRGGEEPVREFLVSLYRSVVDHARHAIGLILRRPLPWHAARERQHVHLHAAPVHPFHARGEIVHERGGRAAAVPPAAEVSKYFQVGRWRPVGMSVDRAGGSGHSSRSLFTRPADAHAGTSAPGAPRWGSAPWGPSTGNGPA